MQKWILPLGALLLLLPNFFNADINDQWEPKRAESFDAGLSRLSTIQQLATYVDSIAAAQHISNSNEEYLILLEKTISKRFYHGFSRYKLNENWVAAISEKVMGRGLACIVTPDDMMKSPEAACSQQSIIMMELLKKKNIDYRKIGFPHHYALEAKINGNWYFTDPDQEPIIPATARLHQNWEGKSDNLKPYYNREVYRDLDYAFGIGQVAVVGQANEVPAKKLSMFHSFTFLLSHFAWCLPLVFLFKKVRKKNGAKVIKMVQPVMTSAPQQHFLIS